ncbi:MAG: 4-hydroxy-tetrahydrodipicolinate reductase [Verrucomicrobiales bacterium]
MTPGHQRCSLALTMSDPLKILVTGCRGRMGEAVIACVGADSETIVERQIDLGDPLEENLAACDAVIDFSFHGFTVELAKACVATQKLLVIGTTGHTDDELAAIREASKSLPICFAPNYSVGVNTLFWLTRRATEILGSDFDLEVVEMHHRMKIDAPSGTAKRLGEILAEASGVSYENDTQHGRVGEVGARTDKEIGMHSLRGGDVVGDHTVIYAGDGERVELTHKASNRNTFANGAVRAAKWLRGKQPGMFDMQDVLGLK